MSISELRDSDGTFLEPEKKEIVIERNGKKLVFYAKAITYVQNQQIAIASRQGQNLLTLLISESITDSQGNKFTYDEVLRLKKEIAEPFMQATLDVNGKGAQEKKD